MIHLVKVLLLSTVTFGITPNLYAGHVTSPGDSTEIILVSYDFTLPDVPDPDETGPVDAEEKPSVEIESDKTDPREIAKNLRRSDSIQVNPENPAGDLIRQGRNAIYLEMFGNSLNLISLNYERLLTDRLNIRIGGSYLGFSSKVSYEGDLDDLFVDLYSVPVSFSYTLFDGIRQLELGVGATYFAFSFWGGTYEVGYLDVDLGNNYKGVALTSIIGYRVSIKDYLFRIGLSPTYMITIDNELSGFFEEMKDRGVMDFHDWLDFRGYRVIPGLSFGRTF